MRASGSEPDRHQVGRAGRCDRERRVLQAGDPGVAIAPVGHAVAEGDHPVGLAEIQHELEGAVGQDRRALVAARPAHGPDRLHEAVEKELAKRGFEKTDAAVAQLLLHYHVSMKQVSAKEMSDGRTRIGCSYVH